MGKRSFFQFCIKCVFNKKKTGQIKKASSRHVKFTYPLMPAQRAIKVRGEFFSQLHPVQFQLPSRVKMKTEAVPYISR